MKHRVRWMVIFLPLALGGCVSNGGNTSLGGGSENQAQHELLRAESKNRLFVKGFGEVVVGSRYVAASGRTCRRLTTLDGGPLPLRSCQKKSGQWYTTRSISVSLPSSGNMPKTVIPKSAEMVSLPLEKGESLWSFASRTTGDPLNWKQIAVDNKLSDVDRVKPNQILQVQLPLLKGGL